MKKCSRCNEWKDEKKFKVDKRQRDGRTITCRFCYKNNQLEKFFRTNEQIESQRNKLKGRKYSLEHRLAISEGQKKAVKEGRHPWKKKENEHPNQERCHLKYKLWKEKVFEINGKKCFTCGREDRLQCHHIKSFKDYPDLRFEPNNGQILCISCHMRLHRKRRDINKES